jgi:type III secretory pathway component EscT
MPVGLKRSFVFNVFLYVSVFVFVVLAMACECRCPATLSLLQRRTLAQLHTLMVECCPVLRAPAVTKLLLCEAFLEHCRRSHQDSPARISCFCLKPAPLP